MAKRAKTKPKPAPKVKRPKVVPEAPKASKQPAPKPAAKAAAKRVGKAAQAIEGRRAVKAASKATKRRAAEAEAEAFDGLAAPMTNEYTSTSNGTPEPPLTVIDTATHEALVAVGPVSSGAGTRRHARTKTSPPQLATIAPRGVFLPDRVIVDTEGDTFPSTKLDEHGRDESILPAATLDAIRVNASVGLRYFEAADTRSAFDAFSAGFDLVPEPFENWNAAGWLLVAMGECAVRAGDFERAFPALRDAMHCPGTVGNPWVHLRLGQVRLELADKRAVDDLSRAYLGGGRSLFAGLDAKYLALVEKSLEPRPGHDRLP